MPVHFLYPCPFFWFLKDILCIYFQREEKGRRKRGRETFMCERNWLVTSCWPLWGPGPQPSAFWFTGRYSSHWATPARALVDFKSSFYKKDIHPLLFIIYIIHFLQFMICLDILWWWSFVIVVYFTYVNVSFLMRQFTIHFILDSDF